MTFFNVDPCLKISPSASEFFRFLSSCDSTSDLITNRPPRLQSLLLSADLLLPFLATTPPLFAREPPRTDARLESDDIEEDIIVQALSLFAARETRKTSLPPTRTCGLLLRLSFGGL